MYFPGKIDGAADWRARIRDVVRLVLDYLSLPYNCVEIKYF